VTLQVFGDRVLVTPKDDEKTSAGGIVLAQTTNREYKVGVVKAVARARTEYGKTVYNEVKVGDTVYYDRFTRISEDVHLISISNVLCFERGEQDELDELDKGLDELE